MYKTPTEELIDLKNAIKKWNTEEPPLDGSLIAAQFGPDADPVIARWMLPIDGDHVWETTEGDTYTKDPIYWYPLPPLPKQK